MKYEEIEKILSQNPLSVAIKLHTDTFGYPPEFAGRTRIGDPVLAVEVHKSIAKGEPYDEYVPRVQQNEDGTTTIWEL
jgi:hypothetical protein